MKKNYLNIFLQKKMNFFFFIYLKYITLQQPIKAMKSHLFLLVLLVLVLSVSCKDKSADIKHYDHFYGLWASDQCQLVHTSQYTVFFYKQNKKVYCQVYKLVKTEDEIQYDTKAQFIFSQDSNECQGIAKDFCQGDDVLLETDNTDDVKLGNFEIDFTKEKKNVLEIEGKGWKEILNVQNKKITFIANDKKYALEKIEEIKPANEAYDMTECNDYNVHKCMSLWETGANYTREGITNELKIGTRQNQIYISCSINNPKNMMYCRTSRQVNSSEWKYIIHTAQFSYAKSALPKIYVVKNMAKVMMEGKNITSTLIDQEKKSNSENSFLLKLKQYSTNQITFKYFKSEELIHITKPVKRNTQLEEWFLYDDAEKSGNHYSQK